MSSSQIKTKFLIISDTHAARPKSQPQPSDETILDTDAEVTKDAENHHLMRKKPTGFRDPLPSADVVLHCGDLTKRSHVSEYQRTFDMIGSLDAPLKLVIPGNHDGALDRKYWADIAGSKDDTPEHVLEVIKKAEANGVKFLTEGTHEFELANGAKLKIYTSQYTPEYGFWGWQYSESVGHIFDIPEGVDIVMTHGPPRGILDFAGFGGHKAAGCPCLLRAVHKARPKIHCFGHIHEAWGANHVRWKDTTERISEAEHVVDPARSKDLLKLETVTPKKKEDFDALYKAKLKKLVELSKQRGLVVDLTEGEHTLEEGKETLFVNAAIMNARYYPTQMPWLIDINLPKA